MEEIALSDSARQNGVSGPMSTRGAQTPPPPPRPITEAVFAELRPLT